ncbi:MAG: DUF2934 domain-containing protein [Halomonas sp.]|nr:DUF2934 domain-containing protein [Halomonas sp.]MCC5883176.1 DUF2934 domain-containing protein [Halomonas sp.]
MADEERIRNLAYEIWESEGRPEGQQQRHWDMALKIVAAEQAAGMDAELEELGEPVEETPIFEDDLPLEDDEVGIQENRLPLDPPDGRVDFDELPYRDDHDVAQDVPVQDRGSPGSTTTDSVPTAASRSPLPAEEATSSGAQNQDIANRGGPDTAPSSPDPGPGPMEPLPAESATAKRKRKPRRADDGLSQPDGTDTSQVPGKTAKSAGSKRSAKAGDSGKAAKTSSTTKAKKSPSRKKPKE